LAMPCHGMAMFDSFDLSLTSASGGDGVVRWEGGSRVQRGQGWTKSKVEMRYGLKFLPCQQGVRQNARKKKIFEFWNSFWWVVIK
jgi:hypothetical protein